MTFATLEARGEFGAEQWLAVDQWCRYDNATNDTCARALWAPPSPSSDTTSSTITSSCEPSLSLAGCEPIPPTTGERGLGCEVLGRAAAGGPTSPLRVAIVVRANKEKLADLAVSPVD